MKLLLTAILFASSLFGQLCNNTLNFNTTTPGTTSLLTGAPGQIIQVCALWIQVVSSAIPTTFQIITGTGSTCTSPSTMTLPVPGISFTSQDQVYSSFLYAPPAGASICLTLSATPVAAVGQIAYTTLAGVGVINITGTMNYPDTTPFNGTLSISLQRSTVTNVCATPNAAVAFQPVIVKVINGVPQNLNLYATACLSPANLAYTVMVYNTQRQLIARVMWKVPNNPSGTADITQLGG